MFTKALMFVVLALCGIYCLAAPILGKEKKMERAMDLTQSAQGVIDENGVDVVECDEAVEPQVPTEVPTWASKSEGDLKKDGSVEDLNKSGAFAKGFEIVIKKCDIDALEAAVSRTEPKLKGEADPSFDIFFDCGTDDMYVIYIRDQLEFGKGSPETAGTFRLLAPNFNVELNGGMQHRIIRVSKSAHLTVFGLRFRHGHQSNLSWDIDDRPAGGWNGGAILVAYQASAVAYKCSFLENTVRSRYVRWGSGGAIMAETEASLLVWDCYFHDNHGTNAGAIGASSARTVQVVQSTFEGNVGYGGYDLTKEVQVNGRTLPIVTVRAGAMRIDSVTGYPSSEEHVLVCNSVFRENRIEFTRSELAEFGYDESEVHSIRTGGAALSVWNAEGNMNIQSGDVNMFTMRGCVFEGNFEDLPWTGSRMGMYVLEAEGEGNIKLYDVAFSGNSVQDAICKFDNSNRFNTASFELALENIEFSDNSDVREFRFNNKSNSSKCEFQNVDAYDNVSGDCLEIQALASVRR